MMTRREQGLLRHLVPALMTNTLSSLRPKGRILRKEALTNMQRVTLRPDLQSVSKQGPTQLDRLRVLWSLWNSTKINMHAKPAKIEPRGVLATEHYGMVARMEAMMMNRKYTSSFHNTG